MYGGMTMGPVLQNIVPDACGWHSHFSHIPIVLSFSRCSVYIESTPSRYISTRNTVGEIERIQCAMSSFEFNDNYSSGYCSVQPKSWGSCAAEAA